MVDFRDHLENNNLKNPVCKLWGFQSLIRSQWSFGASLVSSFQLSRASSSPFLSLSLLPLYLSHHLPLVSHLFIYLPACLFVSPPSSPSSVPALNCIPGPSSGGRRRCWHPEWLGGRAEAGQILPPSLITWEKGGELDMDAKGGRERGGVRRERETKREMLYEEGWKWKGGEQPPNTVINCLPSIIGLSPKAATASSAAAPCALRACVCARAHSQERFMNICL